jgi:hypothetical protein
MVVVVVVVVVSMTSLCTGAFLFYCEEIGKFCGKGG